MFGTLSRLLRNNNIIRLFAICQIIIVISVVPIFAQPTTQDINGMTQTVYNFTLWSDFTTNVDYYYGQQTASYQDTVLTSMAAYLQKLDYYYDTQTHTIYMYVPATNTVQSVSNKHLPEILSYINFNAAYNAKYQYESELLLSRLVTQMGGTNGSYVQDLALDIDSYLPSLTELSNIKTYLSTIESIDWINSSSQLQNITDSSGNIISTYDSSMPIGDYYFNFSRVPRSENNTYRLKLPVYASNTNYRNDFIDLIELKFGSNTYSILSYSYDITGYYTYLNVYFSSLPTSDFSVHIHCSHNPRFRNELPYVQYLPYESLDSLLIQYKGYLANLHDDLQNLEVDLSNSDITVESNFDDSQILEAIDNLSLTNNDVKLTLNISNNTGSDGSNIIGRLQNFFNNGTSISDFFDNVDDAESGWFTQTNSDLINTLSGGYVNLYE